ncbi:PH domain-containing protein [Glaciibacter sp. 2TAF33]|uniref:PH domain-containing protein n=1 Tax=Glaciibacter sp. 2TAF33 TaxID=3233015 RepID=UPI003F8F5A9B
MTTLADTTLADGQWHRLHPATPLLRGGIFIVAVLGFVVANLRERLVDFFFGVPATEGDPIDEIYRRGAVGWALLGIAVILVVILVVFYFAWRMHTFRVNQESVEVRSGLLFRSHRKARLDRIQGVNIVRPLVPRLFGAARLEVSVAGQDANVQLAYLKSALADDLRRDILRLASGARGQPVGADADPADPGQASVPPVGAPLAGSAAARFATERMHDFLSPELDPDAAPPESVVTIPPGRLIGSIVFSGFTVVVLVFVIALIVSVTVGGTGWLLFAILPGVIGSAGYYSSRITKSLRYSIAGTADGVRVGFGLLSTSNETLPPGRIHAINVSQPVIWRPFGWWQIRINKAGHSTNQGAAGQASTTTLPVGTLADVAKVLELILPGFDGDEQRTLIERGMLATGRHQDGFTNAPRRAAWLRPFSWRRTGYSLNRGVALVRRGVLARELVLVPLARLQSVAVRQGPVQRMLRLASVRLHTVTGPVYATLPVIGIDDSVRFFESVSAAAITSAQADTSHRWNGHHPTGVTS